MRFGAAAAPGASTTVGFETPPLIMLVGIGIIVIIYLVSAELLKPLAVTQHDKMKQKEK